MISVGLNHSFTEYFLDISYVPVFLLSKGNKIHKDAFVHQVCILVEETLKSLSMLYSCDSHFHILFLIHFCPLPYFVYQIMTSQLP